MLLAVVAQAAQPPEALLVHSHDLHAKRHPFHLRVKYAFTTSTFCGVQKTPGWVACPPRRRLGHPRPSSDCDYRSATRIIRIMRGPPRPKQGSAVHETGQHARRIRYANAHVTSSSRDLQRACAALHWPTHARTVTSRCPEADSSNVTCSGCFCHTVLQFQYLEHPASALPLPSALGSCRMQCQPCYRRKTLLPEPSRA